MENIDLTERIEKRYSYVEICRIIDKIKVLCSDIINRVDPSGTTVFLK